MKALRTPDARFEGLVDYRFAANYLTVDDSEGGRLRVTLDEKPESLSIASDEWVIAGGQLDLETGKLTDGGFGTWITLKRRE